MAFGHGQAGLIDPTEIYHGSIGLSAGICEDYILLLWTLARDGEKYVCCWLVRVCNARMSSCKVRTICNEGHCLAQYFPSLTKS